MKDTLEQLYMYLFFVRRLKNCIGTIGKNYFGTSLSPKYVLCKEIYYYRVHNINIVIAFEI